MPTVNRININKNGYGSVRKKTSIKPLNYLNKELPRKNVRLVRGRLPKFMEDVKINHEMNILKMLMKYFP